MKGEVKLIELNKIYNEDCLEGMKRIPDNSIDLTVTSPPYDKLRSYDGFQWDFEGVARELYRVTKDGGVLVWVVGDSTVKGSETGTSFRQALYFKEIGFNLHDTMIYHKNNPTPLRGNRYQQSFEYMFVLSKGKVNTFHPITAHKKYLENRKNKQYNKKVDGEQTVREYKATSTERTIKNIWTYNVGLHHTSSDREAFKHPAIFPEQLAEDHILTWSNDNDVILDPFMGSGTTAKMAMLNSRNFIGFEISKDYCDIAIQRVKRYYKPLQETNTLSSIGKTTEEED